MKAKRQWTLLGLALLLIGAFFALPQNRQWAQDKVLAYGNDFLHQKNHLDLEYRRRQRWEGDYKLAQLVTAAIPPQSRANALVLLPPTNYFKSRGSHFHVPEPAVFYYYTGLKTIWANSPEANKANWYVRFVNGQVITDSVRSPQVLHDTIANFVKYGVSL